MHPIIYIVSPPRCRSTILFRALQAQGLFEAFHEPSQAVFDKEFCGEYTVDWFKDNAFQSYDEIKETIIDKGKIGPVLVKEVSFACSNINGCLNDVEYLSNPNIHFIFLIREPLEVVTSLYKRIETEFLDDFSTYTGYAQLECIYRLTKQHNPNRIRFIRNEEFSHPYKLLKSILKPHGLHHNIKTVWPSLGPDFDGNSWHEQKVPKMMQYWHGVAINSTSINYVQSNIQTVDDLMLTIKPEHQQLVLDGYKEALIVYTRLNRPILRTMIEDDEDIFGEQFEDTSYQDCLIPCCGVTCLFSMIALIVGCTI